MATKLALAAGLSLLIGLFIGPLVIKFAKKLKLGQQIREEGPKTHYGKSGTPTMGGVIVIIAAAIPVVLLAYRDYMVWASLILTICFMLVGFSDDYIKTVQKRSLGLRAWQKLCLQLIIGLLFAIYCSRTIGTDLYVPFLYNIDLGIFYIPFVVVVIAACTNAVNLTDGLDGLASGAFATTAIAYMIIMLATGQFGLSLFAAALAGACGAFVWYNFFPAQIFMGDTGSLALGGALAAMAVMSKTELLIPVIGGLFVAETISVIIQVGYFKLTGGKRFFKMAPIHHHFELMGWPETKVVVRLWLISMICAIAGLQLFFI